VDTVSLLNGREVVMPNAVGSRIATQPSSQPTEPSACMHHALHACDAVALTLTKARSRTVGLKNMLLYVTYYSPKDYVGLKVITLKVQPTDRIADVKSMISEKECIPSDELHLYKQVEIPCTISREKFRFGNNRRSLRSYGIAADSTLRLERFDSSWTFSERKSNHVPKPPSLGDGTPRVKCVCTMGRPITLVRQTFGLTLDV
jgi:hypothetical protein